jgi:Na+-driven multidrug efflux pump
MLRFQAVFFIACSVICLLDHVQLASGFSTALLPPKIQFLKVKLSSSRHYASTSSSAAVLKDGSSKQTTVPTALDLLKFGLPTLGIWLLQPILSLIDTSVIGMSASSATSVLQLAALGPGIAWIDSSAYLCQFMGMATTNLYAIAISEGDVKKQQKVLSHATIISTGLGLFLFAIQYTFAKPLVTVLAGSASELIPYALAYSRIRSFASIIAVPTIVGQAAFLASKDSVTPLKAVLVGSIINIVGDLLLVCVLNKGIVGAAWATTASQIGSALYLLAASVRIASKSTRVSSAAPSLEVLDRADVTVAAGTIAADDVKTSINEPKIEKKQDILSLVQFPGFKDVQQYISFCGPLFFVLLMKAFSWSYTTYACSPFGSVSLAAHQIALNIFCIFAIFGDAVSQISQTYLPQFFGSSQTTKAMYEDGKSIIKNIMKISLSLATFNSIFAFLSVSKYGQKVSGII